MKNYNNDTKSRKFLREAKESMREKGQVSKAALYAANAYILKTY